MSFDFEPLLARVRKLSDTFEFADNETVNLEALTRGPNGVPPEPSFLAEARRIQHEAGSLSDRIDKFRDNIKRRIAVEGARRRTPPPPTA